MKIGFPGGPRLEWYDRNPIDVSLSWTGDDVAPHGPTVQATYTTPTGKKAFVGAACLVICRETAATTPSDVIMWVSWTSGSVPYLYHLDNTVDSITSKEVYLGGVLLSGDSITIRSLDVSVGGTLDYDATIVIMEFDA